MVRRGARCRREWSRGYGGRCDGPDGAGSHERCAGRERIGGKHMTQPTDSGGSDVVAAFQQHVEVFHASLPPAEQQLLVTPMRW